MIEITVRQGVKTLTVVSKTPKKSDHPELVFMNRQQRRALVYGRPVRRLIEKIEKLRKEMIAAGIYPPPWPKHRSKTRKYLSGYHGALLEMARKVIGESAC